MATGYTQVTGRMQAVLLHAGAGLLQGSMAIYGARTMATPMLVMSGESVGYGEGDFDPGPQWYRSLNVVGGPQRLVEPIGQGRASVHVRRYALSQRRARGRTRPAYAVWPDLSLRVDGIDDRGMVEARSDARRRAAAGVPAVGRRHREGRGRTCQVALAIHPGRERGIGPGHLRRACGACGASRDPGDRRAGRMPFEFPEVARSLSRARYQSVSCGDGFRASRRERGAVVSAEQCAEKREDRRDRKQPSQGYAGLSGHRRRAVSRGRHGAHAPPPDRSAARQKPDAAAIAARRARWKAEHDKLRQRARGRRTESRGRADHHGAACRTSCCAKPCRTPSMWTRRSCMRGSSAST